MGDTPRVANLGDFVENIRGELDLAVFEDLPDGRLQSGKTLLVDHNVKTFVVGPANCDVVLVRPLTSLPQQ